MATASSLRVTQNPEYQRAIADIDVDIAEIELLRTRRGDIPLPPKVPGKNASKEELQEYVRLTDEYEAAVKLATKEQQDIDVLKGERKLIGAQEKQANAYVKVSNGVARAKQSAGRKLSLGNRWLANVPTPGGVWLPFFLLMFLLLALFPVNGHTRLKWLFLVFLGDAVWPSSEIASSSGTIKAPGNIQGSSSSGQPSVQPTPSNPGTNSNGNTKVLYNQNTNPNTSPSQIVTSAPPPTTPTQQPGTLIPLTFQHGTTSYVESLLGTGF